MTGPGDRGGAPVEEGSAGVRVASPHRIVRASAGSGKTHRLASRYLEILFSGGQPESIVAATFTREAAGEILGRVLTRVAAAAVDAGTARRLGVEIGRADLGRRDCERALRALCAGLDRVVVSTLDSFLFRLTSALRFELGLRGMPAVAALDDPLLAAMREEALEATLRTLADRDWRDLVDLFERLHGASARRSVARSLDALLLELYEIYLEAPAAELWGRLALPPAPEPGALTSALGALEGFLRASAPGALRRALANDLEHARRGDWEGLLERGLAGKIAIDAGASRYGAVAIPAAWAQALAIVVAHARRVVLEARVDRTRATHRLLDVFHGHYWSLRRRRGLLLFNDLAAGLLRSLPARPSDALEELYYRIDARVGHLLLDEFQDTSLAQWSVLRPIAEEIRAWGDGSRTFFCVGDPKQAIYGWRGGCADLFDQIEEDLDLDPTSEERLEESFRSSPIVLDVVNLVFGRLASVAALAEHGDTVGRWSAAFGQHRARVDLPGYAELVESPPDAEHLGWAARRVSDLAVALRGGSIAVLVQTNDQAAAVLEALRREGVEASGEGVGAVADDPAVAAVIAALRLADHPGDSIAAFHVARSPIGAVLGLGSLDPGAAIEASRRLRRAFVARPPAALIAEWRRALRPVCDRRGLLRLAQAVDLAARFDREGGGRPGELATFLTRALVESPRQAGVRVMTLHRAKGLEFDAVVLPALERPLLRGPDPPVYLVRRSPLAPVESVHRAAPASVRRLAPELEEGFAQERARRLRDDLSALYVGLTRARHCLQLWVEAPAPTASGARPVASFAAILRSTLAAPAAVVAAPAAGANAPQHGETTSPESGVVLYRAGALETVSAALHAAKEGARAGRQGALPLAPRRGSGAGAASRALRPAVGMADLGAARPVSASALLAAAVEERGPGEERWREIEAALGGSPGSRPEGAAQQALVEARAWLLAGGRRLERAERARRFVCRLGETTVAGELPRLWIADSTGAGPRAVVGACAGLLPWSTTTALTPALGEAPAPPGGAWMLAAARVLGLDQGSVGLLVCDEENASFVPPR